MYEIHFPLTPSFRNRARLSTLHRWCFSMPRSNPANRVIGPNKASMAWPNLTFSFTARQKSP
jgi:hypothetical protein